MDNDLLQNIGEQGMYYLMSVITDQMSDFAYDVGYNCTPQMIEVFSSNREYGKQILEGIMDRGGDENVMLKKILVSLRALDKSDIQEMIEVAAKKNLLDVVRTLEDWEPEDTEEQ